MTRDEKEFLTGYFALCEKYQQYIYCTCSLAGKGQERTYEEELEMLGYDRFGLTLHCDDDILQSAISEFVPYVDLPPLSTIWIVEHNGKRVFSSANKRRVEEYVKTCQQTPCEIIEVQLDTVEEASNK